MHICIDGSAILIVQISADSIAVLCPFAVNHVSYKPDVTWVQTWVQSKNPKPYILCLQVLGRDRSVHLGVEVQCAGLLLSQDHGGSSIPILEAALAQVDLQAQVDHTMLEASLSAMPHINTYSSEKLGWEPLLEPWSFLAEARIELAR